MKLTKEALKNWQFTLSVVILIVVCGVMAFMTMPRSEDPQLDFAASVVVAAYPGTSPQDMEELIVDPIEEALNELEDINKLYTTIREGQAITQIEFKPGSDADEKYQEVLSAVESKRADLPSDLPYLNTMKFSSTAVNILQVALVSHSASYEKLEEQAERLEDVLKKVDGIKKVEIMALPEREVTIRLKHKVLQEYNILPNQVADIISGAGANIPGGSVTIGPKNFTLKTSGPYTSIDEIKRTVIRADGEHLLILDNIADIALETHDTTYHARFDGVPAIFVTVQQQKNTNILQIQEKLHERLTNFAETLPDEIEVRTVFDQATGVKSRLDGFFITLLQGFCLVALVIFLFLGARASVIVVTVIPVSILGALAMLDYSGQGLNQISIIGFVIALGLFVDNAIVVVDNIGRFIKMGYKPMDAAVKGTGQIAWAVVSSTATTILAFMPMVILKSDAGDFMRSLPLTVIYSLLASLLLSLTFTAFLAGKFVKKGKTGEDTVPIAHKGLDFLSTHLYQRTLKKSLKHPVIMLALAILFFVGTLALFPMVGVSLFPKAEKPIILVNVKAPEGTSLAKTDSITAEVEALFKDHALVAHYATNLGKPNPRIYYNTFANDEASSMAQILVHFKGYDRDEIDAFITEIREKIQDIAGAEIEVQELLQGNPIDAPIAFRILGDNLDSIKAFADDVEKLVKATEGTVNVGNSSGETRTDIRVTMHKNKAFKLGVTPQALDYAVRGGAAGYEVSEYRTDDGDIYDIRLFFTDYPNPSISAVKELSVPSQYGSGVPLPHVATLDLEEGPNQISHYDLERYAIVTADVEPGRVVDQVNSEILKTIFELPRPKGVTLAIAGERESRDDSFGGMGVALVIAAISTFAILILQFRSFGQPFIIFSAVPFALSGAILGLFVGGETFSFTAFIGLTGLIGIVLNNSIILVDYANSLLAEGKSIKEAVTESASSRLTPIVITTLTTIGGLIPLALSNSSLWTPLSLVLIGGLIVSTFLVLFIVPTMFTLFTTKNREVN